MTSKINMKKNAIPVTAKDIIIEKLVNYYRTHSCDRYGQLKTVDIFAISHDAEEQKTLREIVQIQTYGWKYGTYVGFSPWGCFLDKEVENLCRIAFGQNPNRDNMNNW